MWIFITIFVVVVAIGVFPFWMTLKEDYEWREMIDRVKKENQEIEDKKKIIKHRAMGLTGEEAVNQMTKIFGDEVYKNTLPNNTNTFREVLEHVCESYKNRDKTPQRAYFPTHYEAFSEELIKKVNPLIDFNKPIEWGWGEDNKLTFKNK